MKRSFAILLSFLLVVAFVIAVGCKKAEEPAPAEKKPAEVPAPAPEPEKKPAEAPVPAPEKKSSETPATKQKAKEQVKAPAAVPKKKEIEAAKEPKEDSIYITQALNTTADGFACVLPDQAKATSENDKRKELEKAATGAAMENAKRAAVDQTIADIKAKTKGPKLKKDLVAAYTNAKLENTKLIMIKHWKDEKGFCWKLKIATMVVPDQGIMKKILEQ